MTHPEPSFEFERQSDRVLATVKLDGRVVYSDRLDPDSARSRQLFRDRVKVDYPGIEAAWPVLEERILNLPPSPKNNPPAPPGEGGPTNPEPCAEEVDGAQLLEEVAKAIRQHVVVKDHQVTALALWIVHTYCHERFQYTPRLLIYGPDKRCGKSTLLRLVGTLASRPVMASNITPSVLFRSIAKWRPSILLDEADSFMIGPKANDETRGVINAGFERTGCVLRCEGDDHEPKAFPAFAPLALAMIGTPHDTIVDRSVPIEMQRKSKQDRVVRTPAGKDPRQHYAGMLSRIVRWTMDHSDKLETITPTLPTEIDDRGQDLWFSLLAIAEVAGADWLKRARAAALALQPDRSMAGESVPCLLLADIHRAFVERQTDFLPSIEIVEFLSGLEERPWAEISSGKHITVNKLASLLRGFKIRPVDKRLHDRVLKGYWKADFVSAWERYLPDDDGPVSTSV